MTSRQGARRAGIVLALLPALASAVPAAAADFAREPRRVFLTKAIYDMAVCEYCGLIDADVEEGFLREAAYLAGRDGLDHDAVRRARIAGASAADSEYNNRGLGGFRKWCRTEGIVAVRRFHLFRARALGLDDGPSLP